MSGLGYKLHLFCLELFQQFPAGQTPTLASLCKRMSGCSCKRNPCPDLSSLQKGSESGPIAIAVYSARVSICGCSCRVLLHRSHYQMGTDLWEVEASTKRKELLKAELIHP